MLGTLLHNRLFTPLSVSYWTYHICLLRKCVTKDRYRQFRFWFNAWGPLLSTRTLFNSAVFKILIQKWQITVVHFNFTPETVCIWHNFTWNLAFYCRVWNLTNRRDKNHDFLKILLSKEMTSNKLTRIIFRACLPVARQLATLLTTQFFGKHAEDELGCVSKEQKDGQLLSVITQWKFLAYFIIHFLAWCLLDLALSRLTYLLLTLLSRPSVYFAPATASSTEATRSSETLEPNLYTWKNTRSDKPSDHGWHFYRRDNLSFHTNRADITQHIYKLLFTFKWMLLFLIRTT